MNHNAFMYFVNYYKKRKEARAKKRLFRSITEVLPEARAIWEQMTDGQRKPYVQMEKEYLADRYYLSAHRTLVRHESIVYAEVRAEAERVSRMQTLVKMRVEIAKSDQVLEHETFYLISMLHFCRTFEQTYLPAELGVVKYSLQAGVQDTLHTLINPGRISLEDEYAAMQHSGRTHQLPIPPDALGLTAYDDIATMLLSFTEANVRVPILFTDAQHVPIVECILREMLKDYIMENTLYVYSLAELFCLLKQAADGSETPPPVDGLQALLDQDVFSSTAGISCQYHEPRELFAHCALSECVRWAYTISTHCCAQMNIELLPGRHIPLGKETDPSEAANELVEQSESSDAQPDVLPAAPKPPVKPTKLLQRIQLAKRAIEAKIQK